MRTLLFCCFFATAYALSAQPELHFIADGGVLYLPRTSGELRFNQSNLGKTEGRPFGFGAGLALRFAKPEGKRNVTVGLTYGFARARELRANYRFLDFTDEALTRTVIAQVELQSFSYWQVSVRSDLLTIERLGGLSLFAGSSLQWISKYRHHLVIAEILNDETQRPRLPSESFRVSGGELLRGTVGNDFKMEDKLITPFNASIDAGIATSGANGRQLTLSFHAYLRPAFDREVYQEQLGGEQMFAVKLGLRGRIR